MIFCRDESVLWTLYKRRAKVLMQLRFDGVIGFPGGLVDNGEGPIEAVNRELLEEAGISNDKCQIKASDHLISHYHKPKNLVLHFFTKEVSPKEFQAIEKGVMEAEDYGVETCGIIQPPLYTMGDGIRGLPAFLSNKFCGNARQQLLYALQTCKILEGKEIDKALLASQSLLK
ncbi:NUDT16 [Acanthosepion pharaonis]|uniref:U8 snoRNA-decapping enzyme n=1 Tax=Acanthosepion pharaonis TaxID=158019 RepID=A0A812AJU9_ACAPH|nr:NUDT16 [Sepia pharaonis]